MVAFWIGAAVMVAVGLALILPPLLGKGRATGAVRDALNVDIYKDRLAELEGELANGILTGEQYEQAKEELQRDLLFNTETGNEAQGPKGDAPAGRWVAVFVGLGVPLLAVILYLQMGAREFLDAPPQTQAAAGAGHQQGGGAMSPEQVDAMVQQLVERLKAQPDDAEGWLLLGRTLAMMQRYKDAADAYANAYRLVGDEPEMLAQYAEILALANNGVLEGRPVELAERALEKEPRTQRALWLLGIAAVKRGEAEKAIGYWERLLALVPEGSGAAQRVQESIAQARGMAGAVEAKPAPVAQTPASSGGTGTVRLHVALAGALASKVAPGDALFIFARAPEGGRMPVAIVRRQVKDLPLEITLDDSSSMMPTRKLSDMKEVALVARVSKAGSANPQPGDLEGDAAATVGGDGVVQLVIDREIR